MDVEPVSLIDGANTGFILICSALVLLMTPGLAFFYGGMSRSKSVLNMMMMSFSAIGVVSVLWVIYGYAIAFGNTKAGGLFSWNSDLVGLDALIQNLGNTTSDTTDQIVQTGGLPDIVFAGFQLMFAVITVALISGAVADRMKFGSWMVFMVLWATLVYFPVAHWVFGFGVLGGDEEFEPGAGAASGFVADSGGWIVNRLGALDLAGGTAVHINAGAAALALIIVLGKRKGFGKEAMRPHNLPLVMIGAGLLWFGWFGFNAGSAFGANGLASLAFMNTNVATAMALVAWIVTERIRDGHFTTLGAASGAVAGLVAITPASGFVGAFGALVIGIAAGVGCFFAATTVKHWFRYDDSLDAFGVHCVGGIIGALLTGVLNVRAISGVDGSLLTQAGAVITTLVVSGVGSFILLKAIDMTIGLRVTEEQEREGLDLALHGETVQ